MREKMKELGESFKNLNDKFEVLTKRYSAFFTALDVLGLIEFDEKKEVMNTLMGEMQKSMSDRNAIQTNMMALQEECDHNDGCAWEPDGHDSHKNYYKCSICGKEMSV